MRKILLVLFVLVCSVSFAAKFCSECGKALPGENAKFCPDCGAGIATPTQIVIQTQKTTTPDPKKIEKRFCQTNLKVIEGAVEFYNLDYEKMTALDQKRLIETKALDSEKVCPATNKDEYVLEPDGSVTCKYHKLNSKN